MRLLELLVRTRLQIFTYTKGSMKNGALPIGAGGGFILSYKGKKILITADHVCHPYDHVSYAKKRVYDDMDVSVVNNWILKTPEGVDCPIITPLGGFYYFDKIDFSIDKGFGEFRPFDATFSIIGDDFFRYPFKSEPLLVSNGENVIGGYDIIHISSDAIILPQISDRYFVYGHTKYRLSDDKIHLSWRPTLHEDLQYLCENGDYYVLKPNENIKNEDWEGISGSPVLNQDGYLLGILCGGSPIINKIFVMKIQSIISLIDTTIGIEQMGNNGIV